MNLTYQRAKRHAAWLLQGAEEDEQFEQADRRARRNRQRRLYITATHHGDRPRAA
jgi:hypothetical protein